MIYVAEGDNLEFKIVIGDPANDESRAENFIHYRVSATDSTATTPGTGSIEVVEAVGVAATAEAAGASSIALI